jgi:hypothetical protein
MVKEEVNYCMQQLIGQEEQVYAEEQQAKQDLEVEREAEEDAH